ncbi:glycerol-3-phosphate cytidylyltransferase [uncultured Clostridium sp.]|jgi:glycerol-3-phosphate cytidylyltransferase|uniref:glycerol-3-phosphate cytidylyltransferase n=1 Tax=uncultured Clostridium sp. TaxID=59620 RepID=UPI00262E3090|nr:glycerol-3-phosphate cytidylyltransferase [uncultured Clostridium sp.]
MKKIITYGTFDLLHYGHINILKRAKAEGDYLIVGLSTDDFNLLKDKKSHFTYEQRKLILESIRYVDEIIPENSWEQKLSDIVDEKIDTFVIGNDWIGKFDYLKEYCEVVYLERTEGISTSKIKDDLSCVNKLNNMLKMPN